MEKKNIRTCFGCKANCSRGCAFGFQTRKLRIGEGTSQRVHKFPVEACIKVKTQLQFDAVATRLESQYA